MKHTALPAMDGALPEEANTSFSDLVCLMSHDMRAMVRALKELPLWIQEDLEDAGSDIPEQTRSHFELMHKQAVRLDKFLIGLTCFARSGTQPVTHHVNISETVQAILQSLGLPDAFEFEIDIACPDLLINQDDLENLLSALLSNAVKHHHRDRGHISVRGRTHHNWIEISVTDDGPGIDAKHHAGIFDLFTTLEPRDVVEGSGIGLPIGRKVCEAYGGTLDVHSCPDIIGSTFVARLPVTPPVTQLQ